MIAITLQIALTRDLSLNYSSNSKKYSNSSLAFKDCALTLQIAVVQYFSLKHIALTMGNVLMRHFLSNRKYYNSRTCPNSSFPFKHIALTLKML